MLPLKDQAFDDDFAYINTVERFVQTGKLTISEWAAVTMIFQAYWGALFAKIFGLSIKSLHLSTIVMLYFGLVFFYLLLRRLGLKELKATVFTLFLLGSPWVFQFTYSFMSDIPYISLLIISLYFYVKGLQTSLNKSFILGSLFAGLAFLTRQIGVVIPIAIFLVIIYKCLSHKKIFWKHFVFSLVPFTIIYIFYTLWHNKVGPTAPQVSMGPPAFKKGVLPYILPFNTGFTVITARLYIHFLQRILGYLNVAMVFLLPIFFIFKIKLKYVAKFLKENRNWIFATAILVIGAYIIDYLNGSICTQTLPYRVVMFDSLFNWKMLWPRVALISSPLWIVIIAVTLKKISRAFLDERKDKLLKFFKILTAELILVLLLQIKEIYRLSFPYQPTKYLGLLGNIRVYLTDIVRSPLSLEIIKETWFFFLVALSGSVLVIYTLCTRKLKLRTNTNNELLLLGLILIGQISIATIFLYGFWQQYIIQLLPIILIWLAVFFRNIKLSYIRTVIVVIFFIYFSLQAIRNRYQSIGSRWELQTKLVKSGISPLNLPDACWAWKPYWFFEKTFEEGIKEAGGDKFKVTPITRWNDLKAKGQTYNIILVSADTLFAENEIILESKPFWIFWQKQKFIITEK